MYHSQNLGSRAKLLKQAEDGVEFDLRKFGLGQSLRPQLINFVRSERILIKDVTSISKQEVPLTAQHEPQGGLKVMSNLNSKLTSLLQPQQAFQLLSWL